MKLRPLLWPLALLAAASAADERPLIEFTSGGNLAVDLCAGGTRLVTDLAGVIWTLPASGGGATPLTEPGFEARRPRCHPDGTEVVFEAVADGYRQLWSVPLDGGEPRTLTRGLYDHHSPAFMPDGSGLVLVSDRSGSDDLWRLTLADGRLEQISFHSSTEADPAVSPDGHHIAFISRGADGDRLRLRGPQGQTTTLHAGREPLHAPAWRPDGAMLTVVKGPPGAMHKMMLLPSPERLLRPTSWREDVYPAPAVWRDGQHFIYAADGGLRQRRLGSRESEGLPFFGVLTAHRPQWQPRVAAAPDDPARRPVRGLRAPRLSPDGEFVAFTALGRLWRADRDGTTLALTGGDTLALDPDWSPDGRWLVYAADRDGTTDIWRSRADGSGSPERLVSTPGTAMLPAWSPDGTRVAFIDAGPAGPWGPVALRVYDVNSGRMETLTDALEWAGRPDWLAADRLVINQLAPDLPGDGIWTRTWRPGDARSGDLPGIAPGGRAALPMDGPVVSRDGGWLLQVRDGRLWRQPLLDGGAGAGSSQPVGDGPAKAPSVSADGRYVLHVAPGGLQLTDTASSGADATRPWPLDLPGWRSVSGDTDWVLQAGRIYDPVTGGYEPDRDIHISGQRIVAVVERGAREHSGRVVDARHLTVLPGLIDLHARHSGRAGWHHGGEWLAHGVTTVREPVSDPLDAMERHEAWASGQRPGPRLYTGGVMPDGPRTAHHAAASITDADALDRALAWTDALHLHDVRTGPRLPLALWTQARTQAHAMGARVSVASVQRAGLLGGDVLEPMPSGHGGGWSDLLSMLARSRTTLVPLLASGDDVSVELVADLMARGGSVGAGSGSADAAPGAGLHRELERLHRAGLSRREVLRAATLDAARILGADGRLGRVSEGRLADLVVVDGDPLEDLAALGEVRFVIAAGRYYSPSLLRQPRPPVTTPDPAPSAGEFDTSRPPSAQPRGRTEARD